MPISTHSEATREYRQRKLLKFHVEIPTNEARNPPGGLCVDERISAKGASVEKVVGGPMCIAVNVIQPDGIPTTRVPHHSHEPGAHDRWDQRDTTPTDNDGEEAGAIRVGHGQENLTPSLADSPKDGTPFPYPCLLDQCDIPAKGRKVCPSLREAREVGRDNVRTRVRGLANAVMALAICA